MMDALKVHVAFSTKSFLVLDNQAMLNTNGAGAVTAEQNSYDADSELFQVACSGNALIVQPLLSATGAQSHINYTDGDGCTSLFKAVFNGHESLSYT
jgi:hypothetical protein